MTSRRLILGAVVFGLVVMALLARPTHAQPSRGKAIDPKGPLAGKQLFDTVCPECDTLLEVTNEMTTIKCPKCGKTSSISRDAENNITLKLTESSDHPAKKYLLYGGGALLGLGLIALLLKYTVFKAAPVKKKKRKPRYDDEEDDEDDRPRRRRPTVVDDEDEDADERPRRRKGRREIEDDD